MAWLPPSGAAPGSGGGVHAAGAGGDRGGEPVLSCERKLAADPTPPSIPASPAPKSTPPRRFGASPHAAPAPPAAPS
eukprot:4759485-Prymnesium_polylepis.1